MVQDYLSKKHEYGKVDCIELIRSFYAKELNLSFYLPPYPKSREWLKHFSAASVDHWASSWFTKVELTDAQNYDVMIFKSEKSELIIHFGMYLMPSRMLHVEEGGFSCIQSLSQYWVDRLHAVYRHNDLV